MKVLIADDQPLIREGFRRIISDQDDMEVVGEAADGDEAIHSARRLRPDVVVIDIRMPRVNGLVATRRILEADPQIRVLVLTTFDLDEYVYEALHAGASGFLLKDATLDEFVGALRLVAAGDALLAPRVTRRVIEEFVRRPSGPGTPGPPFTDLTPREDEILRMVVRGLSNGDIADDLVISEATVKSHVGAIFLKLGVRDRVQAVIFAYESGWQRPGGG
jgi:DNA-binding NarL/FixJ family response regulator